MRPPRVSTSATAIKPAIVLGLLYERLGALMIKGYVGQGPRHAARLRRYHPERMARGLLMLGRFSEGRRKIFKA